MSRNSRIFEGFKSVGFVSTHIPHIVRYIDKLSEVRVITATNNTFLVFNHKLKLIETCVSHSSDINVLSSDSKYVFTAADNEIFGWKYGHKWKSKSFVGCLQRVEHILPFGPHLIGIDAENVMRVWNIGSQELILTLPFNEESFKMTSVLHPLTYINKILIGSSQGSLQLWNIRTQTLVYTFKGWNSRVTQLSQAPAIDVVAIGLDNGSIIIHNLRMDETIMKFKQEWGSVKSLSFRSDGQPFLVSSSNCGHLAIWNLQQKRLETQMRHIHNGSIAGTTFINKQSLLVTNSSDNSLKVWSFDSSDGSARLLYQREGHTKPSTKIRFHGSKGQYVLSAGLDSTLRAFSIYSERLNKNLGMASLNRKLSKKKGVRKDLNKMKPIVDFTAETTREKEWDGIAACHRRISLVTTWSFDKCKMGQHKLLHQRFNGEYNVVALCVSLSFCGNFVTIGYNSGHIDRFNIQSGLYRASYGERGHDGPVRGVASDALNQFVFSGGNDSKLKFWAFKATHLLDAMTLNAPISQLIVHKESSLIAVSLDNFDVNVIDSQTRRVIRVFGPHKSRVTDMAFNNESRWLITSSMDSIIRIWDLPLGLMIDAFQVSTPCVSLAFSPSGEFLATAHSDDLGIYLWANISLYSPISLRPIPEDIEPIMLSMPVIRTDEEEEDEEKEDNEFNIEDNEGSDEQMDINREILYKSPEQLAEDLITLSTLPDSKWKNLIHLDLIKKRNKPKEVVKKGEGAPFFLPTVAGLDPKFLLEDTDRVVNKSSDSRLIQKLRPISSFGQLLMSCSNRSDFEPLFKCMKGMGPSAIDAEIRSLSEQLNGGSDLLIYFLDAMEDCIQTNRDFDLSQSYLGLFLKIHIEDILTNEELKTRCQKISFLTDNLWDKLCKQFNESICLTNYMRSAIL